MSQQAPPAEGPLTGVRVVDFSEAVPGPFFTRCLGDLGADVVKVERPQRDVTFTLQPAVWGALNGEKAVEILDLKQEGGRTRAEELVTDADVVVDGFRPGVMGRLGLGYEAVSSRNPRVIYVSLTGFGQLGPLAQLPGHDLNYLASSGLLAISGERGPANAMGAPIGDLASSMYAVTATLGAYIHRMTTGRGQHLDVAIADCLVHWMDTVAPNLRAHGCETVVQSRDRALTKPGYGVFEAADGAWVAIAALEDKFWNALQDELALDVAAPVSSRTDRVAASEEINASLSSAVSRLDAAVVVRRLQRRDVPVSLVESPTGVAYTEHAVARGLYESRGGVLSARFPVRLT